MKVFGNRDLETRCDGKEMEMTPMSHGPDSRLLKRISSKANQLFYPFGIGESVLNLFERDNTRVAQ